MLRLESGLERDSNRGFEQSPKPRLEHRLEQRLERRRGDAVSDVFLATMISHLTRDTFAAFSRTKLGGTDTRKRVAYHFPDVEYKGLTHAWRKRRLEIELTLALTPFITVRSYVASEHPFDKNPRHPQRRYQVRRTMWQESGPDRESRTGKCMSDLVWLGEREEEKSPGSASGAAATATTTVAGKPATAAAKKPLQLAGNGKRFTHVFCRRWAVPEGLLGAAKGGGGGSGVGGVRVARGRGESAIVVAAASGKGAPEASKRAARGKGAEGGADGGGQGDGLDARPKGAKALSDLSLSVGDMVCISAQGGGASGPRSGGDRGGGGRGGGLDQVRLLTGNVSAVHEDRVEIRSEKRMRVPRRGRKRGGGGGCAGGRGGGGQAGDALDIEDLLGNEGRLGQEGLAEEPVYFRIDKDEWAAGIT